MKTLITINERPNREVEVKAVKNAITQRDVLLLACFARTKGKFDRYTEITRDEAIRLHAAIGKWLVDTR